MSTTNQNEVSFLREQLADLQLKVKLLEAQIVKCVEMVADSKNALIIAQQAQSMAAEVLIKTTTGKNIEEAMGLDTFNATSDKIVSIEDKKNSRMSYFDDLIDENL